MRQVKDAARRCFARDIFTPAQPYITRDTMRLIKLRRYVLQGLRKFRREESEPFQNICKFLPAQYQFVSQESDPWHEEAEKL
eukprot:2454814-Pyramimonas_sp.AAC.1